MGVEWHVSWRVLVLAVLATDPVTGSLRFVEPPSSVTVSEGLANGSVVTRVVVVGDDHDEASHVTLQLAEQTQKEGLVNLSVDTPTGSQVSASVILQKKLDRDFEPNMRYILFEAFTSNMDKIQYRCTLLITDVGDEAPRFENLPYNFAVPENATTGPVFHRVNVTDPDNGNFAISTFTLSTNAQGADDIYRSTFVIDPHSGVISLRRSLDFKHMPFYQYTVTATDGAGLTANASVLVSVLDVQNQPPFFTGLPYLARVPENTPPGSSVLMVSAQDGDTSVPNQVNFMLTNSSCPGLLAVEPYFGHVTVRQKLDRDSGPVFNQGGVCVLTVQAREVGTWDPGQNDTWAEQTVTVTVLDVNDNGPDFKGSLYRARLQENTQRNVPLDLEGGVDVYVSDLDQGDNSRLAVRLLTHEDVFHVVPSEVRGAGSLLVRVSNSSCLDFEQRHGFNLTLLAEETHTAERKNATVTVLVTLTDANDHWPAFAPHNQDTVYVPENLTAGSHVTNVTATDPDSGGYGEVEYAILGSQSEFEVDPLTGEVRVAQNATLDREGPGGAERHLTVQASDKGGNQNTTTLSITLTDVNDVAPVFPRQELRTQVEENDPSLSLIVTASDRDASAPNNVVRYFLEHVEAHLHGNFSINNSTGELTLTAPMDYERLEAPAKQSGTVRLTVTAVDGGLPPLSASVNVTVVVQDANDVAPVFSQTEYVASVPENSGEGETVITILGTDGDGSAPNNQVFYRIESGGQDNFRVDSLTGVITTQAGSRLDREVKADYRLRVLVVDRGSPALNGSAYVTVNVTDVNDEPPAFRKTSEPVSVAENATVGTALCGCGAVDPDLTPDLRYAIWWNESRALDPGRQTVQDKAYETWLAVDERTGEVRVNSSLDRETAERLLLTLHVQDLNAAGGPAQTATVTLTVDVEDVNDNPPQFREGSDIRLTVSEAAPVPSEVTTISASDLDLGQQVTLQVLDTSSFNVTPDGKVVLVQSLDRETTPGVNFTILATDDGHPPLTSTARVHVTVLDANDHDPEFHLNSSRFRVPENARLGTLVCRLAASDLDLDDNGRVTFSLTGPDTAFFRVNASTGEVTTAAPLDRESADHFRLEVIAMDNPKVNEEQRRTTTTLEVDIDDVNDHAPVFAQAQYMAEVGELATVGSSVTMVTARDADLGSNAQLTFSLTPLSPLSPLFTVNSTTGEVTVAQSLKGKAGLYSLEVKVQDGGEEPLSGNASLQVTVQDVNDNKPAFLQPPPSLSVPECAELGWLLHAFQATDADTDKSSNGRVTFVLDNTTAFPDQAFFSLQPEGQLLVSRTLDSDNQSSLLIRVWAQDHGSPPLNASTDVTVLVTDVNDNPPSFPGGALTYHVTENVNETRLGEVKAEDPDADSRICYSVDVKGSEMADHFETRSEDNRTASLWLVRALDREATPTVTLTLLAYDCSRVVTLAACGSRKQKEFDKVQTQAEVRVDDVNDNGPRFKERTVSWGLRHSVPFGTDFLSLEDKVDDPDLGENRRHNFTLIGSVEADDVMQATNTWAAGGADPITLDSNGTLRTNMAFSAKMAGYFRLRVKVSDPAGEDIAVVQVYIIGDHQMVRVTLGLTAEEVRKHQKDIVQVLTDTTGKSFVVDEIRTHVTESGESQHFRTDLFLHAVDDSSQKVMDATDAIQLADQHPDLPEKLNKYNLVEIKSAVEEKQSANNEEKIRFILIGVLALLLLVLLVIVIVFVQSVVRYRRKLRAATILVQGTASKGRPTDLDEVWHSGKSNQNPLFDKEWEPPLPHDFDTISHASRNSLDSNDVHRKGGHFEEDEQEVTLDLYAHMEGLSPEVHRALSRRFLEETLRQHDEGDVTGGGRGAGHEGDVTEGGRLPGPVQLEELEATDL